MFQLRVAAGAACVLRGFEAMAKVIPVIMSGGSGSRLWPLSTDARPKQFQAIDGDLTLIQQTALRFVGEGDVEFLAPVIICNARHLELVEEQFAAIGLAPSAIVLEPVARNTAAVAGVAALAAREIDPEALVLLAPADHVMGAPEALRAAIGRAAPVAEERIVTFGIRPSGPVTGYGYIKRAEALGDEVFRIDRFLEKPPLEQAQAYVDDGGYDWNAGLFLFSPEVMAGEMARHCADVLLAAEAALGLAAREGRVVRLDADAFGRSPSFSVDYAVMEPTDRAAVAPCDPRWSDIGSWSELWKHLPRDAAGNAALNGFSVDSSNTLVWASGGPPVAVVGLENVLVVSTPEGVLVVARDKDQDVRKVHPELAKLKPTEG